MQTIECDTSNLLLRWSLGIQDTVSMSGFSEAKYQDMLWLAKISILSFQRWFPDASFLLLYNGYDFKSFLEAFDQTSPQLLKEVKIINQREPSESPDKFVNPYHFVPVDGGVWMKWVPFRFDITKDEISIDTDIICIGKPNCWYKWLNSNQPIIIAPERFEKLRVNTCGDFHNHPILQDKKPLNCGVVGHRANYDYSERFFEVTKAVRYGETHDSLFITEQGAVNLWVYSLAIEGIDHYVLDFEKNTWVRDFVYFLEKGISVETIHAVSWTKKIARGLKDILERRILDEDYSDVEFLIDVLKRSEDFKAIARHVIRRQLGEKKSGDIEFLLPHGSF